MEELKRMVKAIYDKVVVGYQTTAMGVRSIPAGGQVPYINAPDPLTEAFVQGHWYNAVLKLWQVAGPAHLMPNNLLVDGAPGEAPEGWEWYFNPTTQMIAARKKC